MSLIGGAVNTGKTNIYLARAGYGPLLGEELADRFGVSTRPLGEDAVLADTGGKLPAYLETIFARQFLPLASPLTLGDLDQAVREVVRRLEVTSQRANRQNGRWTLHAFALDDNEATKTAAKLEKSVLAQVKQRLPRLWQRYGTPAELATGESPVESGAFVVQLYLPTASSAWLSVGAFAAGISPYIAGNLRMRARADAPSRSARKIEEAFRALGRMPRAGETAVDLGAAPGGWTYALARHGALVTAVDAADLALPDTKTFREQVHHVRENGLRYHPPAAVDWLCCDMIVAPHETLKVLSYWLDKGWMRHFIINLKLPKSEPWQAIKGALELFARHQWPTMAARHLFHDRWEVTLLGSRVASTEVEA